MTRCVFWCGLVTKCAATRLPISVGDAPAGQLVKYSCAAASGRTALTNEITAPSGSKAVGKAGLLAGVAVAARPRLVSIPAVCLTSATPNWMPDLRSEERRGGEEGKRRR